MADYKSMTDEQLAAAKAAQMQAIKEARATLAPINIEIDRRGRIVRYAKIAKRTDIDLVQSLTPEDIASAEKVMEPG